MSDEQDLAVRLVLAVIRSASTEKIRPVDWWIRAQSALRSGAAMAQSYGQMISTMGRKLQIDTFTRYSSTEISIIGKEIGDFEAFRHMCERDALYVVAEAQAMRTIERESRRDEHEEIRKAGL
jgi:hypothetical protein